MPKNRTITAAHDGATFKRSTARIYSHVIIGRLDVEKLVRARREQADDCLRRNWKHYTEIANGTYQYLHVVSESERESAQKLVALGIDVAADLRAGAAELDARERAAKGWYALAWAGRPDLAAKQVDEWRKPIHCYAEVLAIPVNP